MTSFVVTGKTILLAQRAVDTINERKRVLILTKTKPLNKFLQLLTNTLDNKLTITHVDYFVRGVCKKYNEPYSHPRDSDNIDEHFEHYNPNICLNMFEKYPDEKYDLILIDESQDFYKDWYEALCFAKKDDGQIVFFYDPFQEQIEMSMISDLEKAEDVTKFALKLNFRNTWEITNLLQKLIINFYPENKLLYSKPIENHAKKPELIEINNRNEQIEKITETIDKLVKKDKVHFVTGITWSNVLAAVWKQAFKAKTFLISSNAGWSGMAGKNCNPWYFQGSWNNDMQPEAMGMLMKNEDLIQF